MSSKGKSLAATGDGSALVPHLRFPEFQDSDGWKEVSLQKLARPVTDRATTEDADNVLSLSGEHGLVLQSDYFGKKIAGDSTERYLKIRKDDFVYNDRTTKASSFGTIKRLSKYAGGIVSPIYKCFRFQPSEDPTFWEWYFESGSHDPALGGLVNEGARAGRFNISVTQFLSTNVWRPNESEQQKIADCLDSVDALITAQGRKVEVLRAHKKGLMQQLFPQEGETQPRLRFPEFRGTGEWEEDDFADLIFFQEGPGIMAVDFHDEGVPLVRLSGLTERSVSLEGCNYLDPEKVAKKWSHFRLEVGDILVSCSASFGRPAIVSDVAVGAVFYTGLIRFKPKNTRLDAGYLEVFLGSPYFLRQAESAAVGGGIKHFGPTHLRQMKVPRPPKISEQKRISSCLTFLDDLIAAEVRKLDTLKTHKKGLMQQLFPRVGEVDA